MEAGLKNAEDARMLVQNENCRHEGRNRKYQYGAVAVLQAAKPAPGWGSDLAPSLDRHHWLQSGPVPRKLEFKEWNSDCSLKHIQGIPDGQVKTVLDDLEQILPLEVRNLIDWDHTKCDQDPWKNHGKPVVLTRDSLNIGDRDPENHERRDDQNKVLCIW